MKKQAKGAMKHFLQKRKSTVANLKLRFLTEFHLQKEVLNSEVSDSIQDVLGFDCSVKPLRHLWWQLYGISLSMKAT